MKEAATMSERFEIQAQKADRSRREVRGGK